MKKLGGRKFLAAFVFLIIALSMDFFSPKGLSDNAMWVLISIYTSLCVGNVGEHLSRKKPFKTASTTSSTTAQTLPDLTPTQDALSTVMETQGIQGQALQFIVEFIKKAQSGAPNKG